MRQWGCPAWWADTVKDHWKDYLSALDGEGQ